MIKYVNNIIDNWLINKIKDQFAICFKWEVGKKLYPMFKKSGLKLEDLDEEIQDYLKAYYKKIDYNE